MNDLNELVKIVEKFDNLDKIEKDMNPEDFAKLNINLGFALNSIYFSKLYFYYYNVY